MKSEINKYIRIPFKNLIPGDAFRHNGYVYMKIKKESMNSYNAIHLGTGEQILCLDNDCYKLIPGATIVDRGEE